MTIDASAPERAPERSDLTFLRHRAKPVRAVNPAIAEFVAGRASAHARRPAVPQADPKPAATGRISTVRQPPSAGTDSLLDLSAPAPVPAARPAPVSPPAPSGGSDLLDLSAPISPAPGGAPAGGPPAAPTGASTSLDLGAVPLSRLGPPAVGAGSPAAPARYHPPAQVPLRRVEPRTAPGVPTILQAQNPTVTLTRVQSGVGTLTFEAAVADSVGDLRLGAAYQLTSGRSSTIQHHAGRRFAPPGETRRPILLAARQQFERLSLDLRQVDELERMVVYAFSGNGSQLRWGGTLLVNTFGGDRIEMPIEMPPATAVAVLASVYNVRGELVLRSEMDLVGTTIMQACRGYGFERISWLDDVTPID